MGLGGEATWRRAGTVRIEPLATWPNDTFSVLDFYGPDAEAEMRKTLIKYQAIPDRTEGIQAALAKAKANQGGIVYFPPGRYGIRGVLAQVFQHQQKLVSAQSRHGIGVADAGAKTPADLLQHQIAGLMAESVVQCLEVIQIDK